LARPRVGGSAIGATKIAGRAAPSPSGGACSAQGLCLTRNSHTIGIADYVANCGRIEARRVNMCWHSNAKTRGIPSRRIDDVSVREVERIGI
jgi:hypothetical protein